jgi:hypothetical protein
MAEGHRQLSPNRLAKLLIRVGSVSRWKVGRKAEKVAIVEEGGYSAGKNEGAPWEQERPQKVRVPMVSLYTYGFCLNPIPAIAYVQTQGNAMELRISLPAIRLRTKCYLDCRRWEGWLSG